MKRNCGKCKAYDKIRDRCILEYKQKNSTPLEECPKPLSWKKVDEERKRKG